MAQAEGRRTAGPARAACRRRLLARGSITDDIASTLGGTCRRGRGPSARPEVGSISRTEIRSLDATRDLDGFLAVLNQAEMSPVSLERWLDSESRAASGHPRSRLVVVAGDAVVSIGIVQDDDFVPDGVGARVVTDRGHRRRGHGQAMAGAVEEVLAARRAAEVRTRVREEDAESLTWAERRGFSVFGHTFSSRLDLRRFDPAPHRAAVESAEAAGLRFARFGPGDDGDRLYELFVRLLRDVPDDLHPPDRDYFQREVVERPDTIALVAYDGVESVGLAVLAPRGGDAYGNALTGVLPGYRGRGLARALKVQTAEMAQRAGRRYLRTGNDVRNAPMLAVNEAMGYERLGGVLHLRRLREPA
jgi:GNAT superfamily N-acetyltransferase